MEFELIFHRFLIQIYIYSKLRIWIWIFKLRRRIIFEFSNWEEDHFWIFPLPHSPIEWILNRPFSLNHQTGLVIFQYHNGKMVVRSPPSLYASLFPAKKNFHQAKKNLHQAKTSCRVNSWPLSSQPKARTKWCQHEQEWCRISERITKYQGSKAGRRTNELQQMI